MKRRTFFQTAAGMAIQTAAELRAAPRRLRRPIPSFENKLQIAWQKRPDAALFDSVSVDGQPLVFRGSYGVLSVLLAADSDKGKTARVGSETKSGWLQATLRHTPLRIRPGGTEDALAAEVKIVNTGDSVESATLTFATSTHPARTYGAERVHLPLTAGPHSQLRDLGMTAIVECDQPAQRMSAFYLEPAASDPAVQQTQRLMLIPLACRYNHSVPWRVSMFGSPERAWKFASIDSSRGETGWTASTRVTLKPNQELSERFFLFIHEGEADVAWRAFHQWSHTDALRSPGWLDEVKVHYFDFLSPGGKNGLRGLGYEEDAAYFKACSVGLATQHGYYPVWGDYIHPDRKQWLAMPSDEHGPAEMSIDKMRERVRITRAAGAKAGIYLHTAGFDPTARAAKELEDAVLVGGDGQKRTSYPWDGPDIAAPNSAWSMSMASPEWRKYLLQQAQWIMELIAPDAIVVDETFGGLGYEHHPNRKGPLSPHMIGWVKDLRKLVRSFGADKALLTSDCALSSFVLWADAEGGDHVYKSILGAEAYRRTPVRYLSALGPKAWIPCAWNVQSLWDDQMDLARKTGAAVGVGNGWLEYAGLAGLNPAFRQKLIADIDSL